MVTKSTVLYRKIDEIQSLMMSAAFLFLKWALKKMSEPWESIFFGEGEVGGVF